MPIEWHFFPNIWKVSMDFVSCRPVWLASMSKQPPNLRPFNPLIICHCISLLACRFSQIWAPGRFHGSCSAKCSQPSEIASQAHTHDTTLILNIFSFSVQVTWICYWDCGGRQLSNHFHIIEDLFWFGTCFCVAWRGTVLWYHRCHRVI